MKKLTKVLAAIMLMCATMFVAGCERDRVSDDWVDLGLPSGLLWATRNVGAFSHNDLGDRYAWGETQPKGGYNWRTYQYCNNGGVDQLTKYCNDSVYGYNGFTDDLTTLQPGDDAATANMGGGARTPTKVEWEELINHTTNHFDVRSGVYGWLFTSSNGNSLFLPASLVKDEFTGLYVNACSYWSSSLYLDIPYYAICIFFRTDSDSPKTERRSRCNCFYVRAVRSAR